MCKFVWLQGVGREKRGKVLIVKRRNEKQRKNSLIKFSQLLYISSVPLILRWIKWRSRIRNHSKSSSLPWHFTICIYLFIYLFLLSVISPSLSPVFLFGQLIAWKVLFISLNHFLELEPNEITFWCHRHIVVISSRVNECIVLFYYYEEYFLVFFYIYCNRHVRQHPHQITQISVKKTHFFFVIKR